MKLVVSAIAAAWLYPGLTACDVAVKPERKGAATDHVGGGEAQGDPKTAEAPNAPIQLHACASDAATGNNECSRYR